MLVKNLMEEKQLDFNRPLLSVRRFSSAASTAESENKRKTENGLPPVYKSELRSGPVRNPGTVPFVWEQSPGRPKSETKPQTFDLQHPPPAAPRLPPGRTLNPDRHQAFDKGLEGTSETRIGCLMSSQNAPSNEESSGDGTEETGVSGSEEDNGEAYVDALDALSRSESFFMNCSISGVSGLEDHHPDIKQWGTFSTDHQTRDFMMGRFLPAAKAMASETPQYSNRKQPAPQEQPRMTNKLFAMANTDPFNEGLDGSSLYKRLQGNAALPCKGKFSKPTIMEPEKSGVKLFREFLASESSEWESAPSSPLAEKTVCIDLLKTQLSKSSCPDMNGHRRDEIAKNGEVEETAFTCSSFQADDELLDKDNMLSISMESADKSADYVKTVLVNSFRIQSDEAGDNVDKKLSNQEEISNGSKSLLPLPLPLPKSPSESWLKHALPAVSSKHTASRLSSPGLNTNPRVQSSKVESSDSKWETIVKSARVQHGHLRHSEELLSAIPEV